MSSKQLVILSVFLLITAHFHAQIRDIKVDEISTSKPIKFKTEKTLFQKSILPISIIISGATMSNSIFEKDLQKGIREMLPNNYRSNIDDHTRYAPIILLYSADILGVKSKNHWFDQTKNLTLSILITDLLTTRLKRISNKQRPDGGDDYQSFPSGHTSFAFANASVLFNEFKDSSQLLAYSGYAFAATTGSFRMLNNSHYLSDVLVGAGIAILITELIYHFEPLKKWNPFKKNDNRIALIPKLGKNNLGDTNFGFYFSLQF